MKPKTNTFAGCRVAIITCSLTVSTSAVSTGISTAVGQARTRPAVHPIFDLSSPSTSPFPSNWYTVPDTAQTTGRRVALPMPSEYVANASDWQDTQLLNLLDGFNMLGRVSIPFDGDISVSTATSENVFLIAMGDSLENTSKEGDDEHSTVPPGRIVGINQVVWDPETRTLHATVDELPVAQLVEFGRRLFEANWTDQDGVGRPFTKGSGDPLSDPRQPLVGARSFNRVSGPDANSCQGCHNGPYAIAGGGGDFVTNVFVGAERFDFVTFDRSDPKPTRGSVDEAGQPATLQTVGNLRSTPGLFGAGYLEMVARQITLDLQLIRDSLQPGQTKPLVSKGLSFGSLGRRANGSWDVAHVQGLPQPSMVISKAHDRPSLVIRPWHQSGSVVSLREFANSAYNRHHGIQTSERFGKGMDPDRDGVVNEMTRADVTAVAAFMATLPVPGRVIPNNPAIEAAVLTGEKLFQEIQCSSCHVPALPLDKAGWTYTEPNPFNPPGNLRRRDQRAIGIDLLHPALTRPRLAPSADNPNVIYVPRTPISSYTTLRIRPTPMRPRP